MDSIAKEYLRNHDIDAIGIGIVDFEKNDFSSRTYQKENFSIVDNSDLYFDLASLTKVLTNGVFCLKHLDQLSEEEKLLVEHRAGLPAWGLLSRKSWKEDLCSYKVKKDSSTLYSDYSALRFMLELQKRTGLNFKSEVSQFYDKELKSWMDLDTLDETVQNGFYKGTANFSRVHDPNAQNIEEFLSHAGIFSTTNGLCRTLLALEKELNLNEIITENMTENRFTLGWDKVTNGALSTAGAGCSESTFGHLGFTGTSLWIDPSIKKCIILLTNTTKNYWHDRKDLNALRRQLGEILWQQKHLSLDSYFY